MSKDSFENTLAALEKVVENLEREDLTLEESLRCFEQGIKDLALCQKYLKEAENKVELLLKGQDDTLETASFDLPDDCK